MSIKNQNVTKEDWQYLVILDACRYDYFKQIYKKFLDGKLERRRSPATFTMQWLAKTFTDYYDDVAYISPVGWCRNAEMEQKGYTFDGRKHFKKVYYSSDFEPETITKLAIKKAMIHPNWRFIIHYMCPHAPYHSVKISHNGHIGPEHVDKSDTISWKVKMSLVNLLMKIMGNEFVWKLKKKAGMSAYTMEAVWREGGTSAIKKGYVDELLLGLSQVVKLSKRLPPGKLVVTADHGELLGEKGYWGHGIPKPPLPELTDVPWLEVKR